MRQWNHLLLEAKSLSYVRQRQSYQVNIVKWIVMKHAIHLLLRKKTLYTHRITCSERKKPSKRHLTTHLSSSLKRLRWTHNDFCFYSFFSYKKHLCLSVLSWRYCSWRAMQLIYGLGLKTSMRKSYKWMKKNAVNFKFDKRTWSGFSLKEG